MSSTPSPGAKFFTDIVPEDTTNFYAFEIDKDDKIWVIGCDCACRLDDVKVAEGIHNALGEWLDRNDPDR